MLSDRADEFLARRRAAAGAEGLDPEGFTESVPGA